MFGNYFLPYKIGEHRMKDFTACDITFASSKRHIRRGSGMGTAGNEMKVR